MRSSRCLTVVSLISFYYKTRSSWEQQEYTILYIFHSGRTATTARTMTSLHNIDHNKHLTRMDAHFGLGYFSIFSSGEVCSHHSLLASSMSTRMKRVIQRTAQNEEKKNLY